MPATASAASGELAADITLLYYGARVRAHLFDGTYELFRQHFGYAKRQKRPTPYDATVGVLSSTLQLLQDGATHVAVASDHVIESFRNDLWPGYKTSAGMDPVLLAQLPIMEDALDAMGVTVWAMVEYEADDALAAAALVAGGDERVTQVVIVTPDKDLGQCVRGARIVQYDRRNDTVIDEAGVTHRTGIETIGETRSVADDRAIGELQHRFRDQSF